MGALVLTNEPDPPGDPEPPPLPALMGMFVLINEPPWAAVGTPPAETGGVGVLPADTLGGVIPDAGLVDPIADPAPDMVPVADCVTPERLPPPNVPGWHSPWASAGELGVMVATRPHVEAPAMAAIATRARLLNLSIFVLLSLRRLASSSSRSSELPIDQKRLTGRRGPRVEQKPGNQPASEEDARYCQSADHGQRQGQTVELTRSVPSHQRVPEPRREVGEHR
jgi:hypothetical protein